MLNHIYQLRYTKQFANSLEGMRLTIPDDYQWLMERFLPNLCYYPLQGRLLLNRAPSSEESQRLRWQLARRFSGHEFREVCDDNWLVIYLHHRPYIYLLALISLQDSFSDVSADWVTV